MASHLQPFTPLQVQNTESKFHIFLQLPKELRNKIWYDSIQHTQIFHIYLYDLSRTPAPTPDAAETNHLLNSQHDQRFFIVKDGTQTMSKLFQVNHESREAALSFYRVRLPCWLRTRGVDGELLKPGTLYFNPEHDFLRINSEWPVKNTLFPFLHLLKTIYDPLHVGLRNLILGLNDLSRNDLYLTDPSTSDLDAGSKETFTNTLKNLHQVLFYSTVTMGGRQIHSGMGFYLVPPTRETNYNRSIPIQASVSSFGRLPHDPRTIIEDLKGMYVGNRNYPGYESEAWNQLLEKWGVSLDIEYKWCIAYEPLQNNEIVDKETARRFMQKEDDLWYGIQDPDSPTDQSWPKYNGVIEIGGLSEKYKNEDLEKAVRPAFGFWVFPIQVLDSLKGESEHTVLRDLSAHWPELWLASLPDKA